LINDLATIPVNFIVTLDDYHVIDSELVHHGVTYLLKRLPEQMHLVIATRGDPPVPLSRFRGRGMMQEIRTDDLRFNRVEAAGLVGLLKAPPLAETDIAALTERTKGWAVGLKMALLSMSWQKDIAGFIKSLTGSQRYVMDYLMDEVLKQQTPETVDFLLQTSILERLKDAKHMSFS
jgi:LuxR family maltose regulon positive regulatory protein